MIWISTLVVVLSVILDQITKIIAESCLKGTDGVVVIPNVLSFSYLENRGAAFGIFSDNRWVFMVFSSIAILVMLYFIFKMKSMKNNHPLLLISLSMLVGGGIGNMIDRIFRGYVIDFFKVLFVDFAVFNVADCFVTVGAIILAVYMLFIYKESDTTQEEKKESDTPTDNFESEDSAKNSNETSDILENKKADTAEDKNGQGE